MPMITIRPISVTVLTNGENAYDGNADTSATVEVSRFSSKSPIFTFDMGSLNNCTINSASLIIVWKSGRNTISASVSSNFGTSLLNQSPSTTKETVTTSITTDLPNLNSLTSLTFSITNTNLSSNTLEIHEVYLEVDYTEKEHVFLSNLFLGNKNVTEVYLGNKKISNIYIGDKLIYGNVEGN